MEEFKRLYPRGRILMQNLYIMVFMYALSLSLAHLFLKIGTKQKRMAFVGFFIFLYSFLGITAASIYLIILSYLNLSIAFPATRSASYIFIMILSFLFLKEKLTAKSSIGVIALIIGLFLIS